MRDDDLDPTPPAPSLVWPAACIALLIALALLAVAAARGAPVPPPTKKPATKVQTVTAAALVGSWVMTWRGEDVPTVFQSDGNFWCHWRGQAWVGEWQLKGRTLYVQEWERPFLESQEPDGVCRWKVTLDAGGRSGQTVFDFDELTMESLRGDDRKPGVFALRKP